MPRRKRQPFSHEPYRGPDPDAPYRATDIVSVSVNQPEQMLFFFKLLAEKRERDERVRVPIRQLYDEAVRALMADLRDGTPVFFTIAPIRGTTRRTVWVLSDTAEEIKKYMGQNVRLSQFILTALLRYLKVRGQTFEGFPTTNEEFVAGIIKPRPTKAG